MTLCSRLQSLQSDHLLPAAAAAPIAHGSCLARPAQDPPQEADDVRKHRLPQRHDEHRSGKGDDGAQRGQQPLQPVAESVAPLPAPLSPVAPAAAAADTCKCNVKSLRPSRVGPASRVRRAPRPPPPDPPFPPPGGGRSKAAIVSCLPLKSSCSALRADSCALEARGSSLKPA